MYTTEQLVKECLKKSNSRYDIWIHFLNSTLLNNIAELGVLKGDFTEKLLRNCGSIERYYMIDPWRHLDNWNKPANKENKLFEEYLSETLSKTEFAADKRIILRGKTTEVIEKIPDSELDFAYIDGDHTLKGITIDLIRIYQKVGDGGWIGGDDFSKTIWQHSTKFEPTFVFPFAVYFAEAVDDRIYALPNKQFLIEKNSNQHFDFIDFTGKYHDTTLRKQVHPTEFLKLKLKKKLHLGRP